MNQAALLLLILVAVFAFMVAGTLTLRQYLLTHAAQQVQHSLQHLCHANPLDC